MTVARENWEAWLDPRNDDTDRVRGLMAPPPTGSLDIYAVTTAVNNVKNNGPELLEPLQNEHRPDVPATDGRAADAPGRAGLDRGRIDGRPDA